MFIPLSYDIKWKSVLQKYGKPCSRLFLDGRNFLLNYRKLFFKNCYATFVITLFFRITHFVIVLAFCSLTLWHAKVPEHLAAIFYLNLIFYFFLDLKICGLWTFAQLCIAWLRPHPSPSHLRPQKTYPTTWEPCKREINFKDWLSPLLSYTYIKNGLFRDILKNL